VDIKIPAVSGSSGRLVVERSPTEEEERYWPGRVFENPELSYEEAMLDFAAVSLERGRKGKKEEEETGDSSPKGQKQVLRREEAQLCADGSCQSPS
jgi:hypothetical protein